MSSQFKVVELKPLETSPRDYDELEARLKRFFREYLYYPLLKELGLSQKLIINAAHPNPIIEALYTGKIYYARGTFTGAFNAALSKALTAIGAKFDKRTSSFKISTAEIPMEIRNIIAVSEMKFKEKMDKLDKKLSEIIPEELAAHFKCADLFDKSLWKAERQFQKNVKNITVAPQLTDEQRLKIAESWQNNMNLWIKGWTEEQIKDLRGRIFEDVLGGQRQDSLIPPILKVTRTIQESHEQAVNKAKFLSQQESRLLMAAYHQVRYEAAGSKSYIWRCVHRPHDMTPDQHTLGNVRYSHGLLNGKEFEWSNPPITTNPGEAVRRNHPGQDYRCRCFSRPLLQVRFEKK